VLNPTWVNVGPPVNTNRLLILPTAGAAYYRIQGQ
jgi:hypothetical protein